MTNPSISIIIPTFSRPDMLKKCLYSMSLLQYPRDKFEVIVVDDGSSDPIAPLVKTYQNGLNIQLVSQRKAGPATARNSGAGQAKKEYLVFTDDDCILTPDYLSKLALRLQNEPEAMIGGHTINALPHNLYAATSQLLINYLYTYLNIPPQKISFFTSNNLTVSAKQFHAIGGFDTSFSLAAGEDRDICDRWHNAGFKMLYEPKLIVYHAHHMNLGRFWRQHFNYGRGSFHFHQIRAARQQVPITVERLSFYLNLLLFPLAQRQEEPPMRAWLLVALMLLSQIANSFGFFWQHILVRSERIQCINFLNLKRI